MAYAVKVASQALLFFAAIGAPYIESADDFMFVAALP